MKRHLGLFSFVAFSLFASLCRGEGSTNPFNNQPVLTNSGGVDAEKIADGIVQKDTSSLSFTDQEKNGNDRRQQAQKAENDSNKGKGVAIATGAALTATAIPMLASPIASVRAAGAALMAKAALEFAQAAADKKAADKNKEAKEAVNQNPEADKKPATADASQEAKDKLNNPALDKFLTERGVNSDDFKDKLAKGELSNPEEVLKAVGDTTEFTPDDLAKGNALADKEFGAAVNEPDGKSKLGYDESLDRSPGTGSSSMGDLGGGGGGGAPLAMAGGKSSLTDGIPANARGAPQHSGNRSFAPNNTSPQVPGKAGQASDLGGAGGGDMMGLKGLLGSIMSADPKVMGTLTIRQALERVGILTPQPKQTVFQTAHRIFRGFGKWRDAKARLAMKK